MTLEQLRRVRWREVTSIHMNELRGHFGGRCARCAAKDSGVAYWNGPRRPLEFAHVKPTGLCGQGRGLKNRFLDVLRHPDCYVLLCSRCHRVLDAARWVDRARAADELSEPTDPATVEVRVA